MNPSNPDVDSFGSIRAARLLGAHFKRSFPAQTPPFERDQRLELNSIPLPL